MDIYKFNEEPFKDTHSPSLVKTIVEIPTRDNEFDPEYCDPDDIESIDESFRQQLQYIHNMCNEIKKDGEISIEFDFPPKPNLISILQNLSSSISLGKLNDNYFNDDIFFLFLHSILNCIHTSENEDFVVLVSKIYANLSRFFYTPAMKQIIAEFPYYLDRYTTKQNDLTSMGLYINALANFIIEEDARNVIIQNEIHISLVPFLSNPDIYVFQTSFCFYLHLTQLILKNVLSQEQFAILEPFLIQFSEFVMNHLKENVQIIKTSEDSVETAGIIAVEFLALFNLSHFLFDQIMPLGLEEVLSLYLYETEFNSTYLIFAQNLLITTEFVYQTTEGRLAIFSETCRNQFLKQFIQIYGFLNDNLTCKCALISLLETLHPFIIDNIEILKIIVLDSQERNLFKFLRKVSHYVIFTFSQLSHEQRKQFLIPEFVAALQSAIESRFYIDQIFAILKEMKDQDPQFTNSFLVSSPLCELIQDYLETEDDNNENIHALASEIISDLVE